MANLDWSACPAVESVADRRSGAWVFRNTRMPVATVFENLEVGSSIDEIIEQYDVTREQIQAVLQFAARSRRCRRHLKCAFCLTRAFPAASHGHFGNTKLLRRGVRFDGNHGQELALPIKSFEPQDRAGRPWSVTMALGSQAP